MGSKKGSGRIKADAAGNGHRSTHNGDGKVAELLVVKDDPLCAEAIALLRKKGLRIRITEVSASEYLRPRRDVPKLLTWTGMYTDLGMIERVIDRELINK